MGKLNAFWSVLRSWFKQNGRVYPWRITKNPFHILIAEVLLQQTHVRKVEKVYDQFIQQYGTPRKLAKTGLLRIEMLIQPIGLVHRAVNLKKTAKIIYEIYGGRVPVETEKLLSLPGIGAYIADAIRCYAFNESTIPIDTNVIRLFCRYFGLQTNKTRPWDDRLLAQKIRELYFYNNLKEDNLAVLDFSSLICKAVKPRCTICPLSSHCCYCQEKEQ